MEYDKKITTLKRTTKLGAYLSSHIAEICVVFDKQRQIVGYGGIQQIPGATLLAPLYADNEEVGKALFSYLCKNIPDSAEFISISCPEVRRPEVVKWINDNKMVIDETKTLITNRLYTKQIIPFELDKIYSTWGLLHTI